MRTLMVLALLAGLALAGCASTPDATISTTSNGASEHATLPAPIHASEAVTGSFAGGNLVGAPVANGQCDPAQTAKCYHYSFTINATSANVTAVLKWTNQASDFDLYVMQDGNIVSNDGINSVGGTDPNAYVPVTSQTLHASLEAGEYDLLVVAWDAVQDTFTLDASFA